MLKLALDIFEKFAFYYFSTGPVLRETLALEQTTPDQLAVLKYLYFWLKFVALQIVTAI